jgi:hypothetical protein
MVRLRKSGWDYTCTIEGVNENVVKKWLDYYAVTAL